MQNPPKIPTTIIARHLGCTPRYVRMVLKGEREPDTALAQRIRQAHERLTTATQKALQNVE